MLAEADYNESIVTKKKKSSRTNQETVHNKKKKKKNDDQETLTKPKKRKHLIEGALPGAEEVTVTISNKKKKKDSKVNEEFELETFSCTENKDASIDDEEHDNLEAKETRCKPEKSERKKKKNRKIVLLTDADNNKELHRLYPENISTKKKKIKRSTPQEIFHQIEALSETLLSGTGDAHGKTKKKKKEKKKKQRNQIGIEEAHNHLEPNEETLCKAEHVKKKHKKKRSKDLFIEDNTQTYLEPNNETFCKPDNSKKNHKKKRCKENRIYDAQHNNLELKDEASREPENAKKKNKPVLLEAEVEHNEELQTGSGQNSSTKKKKAKQSTAEQSAHQLPVLSDTVLSGSEDVCEQRLKKKKKKHQDNDERIQIALPQLEMENGEWKLDAHNLTSICNKKKKKTMVFKAHHHMAVNIDTLPNNFPLECGKSSKFNNIKRHMLDDTAPNEILKSKKKDMKFKEKSRSKSTECDDDVEVVSVKKGNTDEVQIDQNYRPLFDTQQHNTTSAHRMHPSRQFTELVNVLGQGRKEVPDIKNQLQDSKGQIKNNMVLWQIQLGQFPHQHQKALSAEELQILSEQLEGSRVPDAEPPLAEGEHDMAMPGSTTCSTGCPETCHETLVQLCRSGDDAAMPGTSISGQEGHLASCHEKVTHHLQLDQQLSYSSDDDETLIDETLISSRHLANMDLSTGCDQLTAQQWVQRILSPPSPTQDSEPLRLVPDTEEIFVPSTLEQEQEQSYKPAEHQFLSPIPDHAKSMQPEQIPQDDPRRCYYHPKAWTERKEAWKVKFHQQQAVHQASLDFIGSNVAQLTTHMSKVETAIKKLRTDRAQQHQTLLSAVQNYFKKMQDIYKQDYAARRRYETDSLQVVRDTQKHMMQLASSAMAIASSLCIRTKHQLEDVSPASQASASQQVLSMLLADLPEHSLGDQGNRDEEQVHQSPSTAQSPNSDNKEDDYFPDNQDLLV